jgi:hypothetical protein
MVDCCAFPPSPGDGQGPELEAKAAFLLPRVCFRGELSRMRKDGAAGGSYFVIIGPGDYDEAR